MIEVSAMQVALAGKILMGDDSRIVREELLHSALSSYHYYTTTIEQIASVYRGILKNHPFKDGNKRVGTLVAASLLRAAGYTPLSNNDAIELAMEVAAHKHDVPEIARLLARMVRKAA